MSQIARDIVFPAVQEIIKAATSESKENLSATMTQIAQNMAEQIRAAKSQNQAGEQQQNPMLFSNSFPQSPYGPNNANTSIPLELNEVSDKSRKKALRKGKKLRKKQAKQAMRSKF